MQTQPDSQNIKLVGQQVAQQSRNAGLQGMPNQSLSMHIVNT